VRAAAALSALLHGERAVADDRTLLLAASIRGRVLRRRHLSLAPAPTSPATARAAVGRTLVTWGVDDAAADEALICVSELVTNAIVHAGTSRVEVTVQLEGDRILLLVADGGLEGAAELSSADRDPEAAGGRGLLLVEGLSRAWGVETTAQGTTVWCELEASPGAATASR
jgi:anti-sigma regulatory factor (Ser/Thr protein kinase)